MVLDLSVVFNEEDGHKGAAHCKEHLDPKDDRDAWTFMKVTLVESKATNSMF